MGPGTVKKWPEIGYVSGWAFMLGLRCSTVIYTISLVSINNDNSAAGLVETLLITGDHPRPHPCQNPTPSPFQVQFYPQQACRVNYSEWSQTCNFALRWRCVTLREYQKITGLLRDFSSRHPALEELASGVSGTAYPNGEYGTVSTQKCWWSYMKCCIYIRGGWLAVGTTCTEGILILETPLKENPCREKGISLNDHSSLQTN